MKDCARFVLLILLIGGPSILSLLPRYSPVLGSSNEIDPSMKPKRTTFPSLINMNEDIVSSFPSVKEGDAVVLCLIDGSILLLDAWTGELRGKSDTIGIPILRGSAAIPGKVKNQHHEEQFQQQIIPSLDGTLFALIQHNEQQPMKEYNRQPGSIEEEEENHNKAMHPTEFKLEELPLKIQDLVDRPVSMCYPTSSSSSSPFVDLQQRDKAHLNEDEEEEECGIIVGQKSTHIYALNPLLGTIHSLQQPQPFHFHPFSSSTSSSSYYHHHSPFTVFLQRTDYSIQHVHINSGKEMWNVSYGHFTPLEFSSTTLTSTSLQPIYESPSSSSSSSCPRASPTSTIKNSQHFSTSTTFPFQDEETTPLRLPYLHFDHSQEIPFILALDPLTFKLLWKQPLSSIVATAQGIIMTRNTLGKIRVKWTHLHRLDSLPSEILPLEIQEKGSDSFASMILPQGKEVSHVKEKSDHEWTLYLPSLSSSSSSLNAHSKKRDLFQTLLYPSSSLLSSQGSQRSTSTALTIVPSSTFSSSSSSLSAYPSSTTNLLPEETLLQEEDYCLEDEDYQGKGWESQEGMEEDDKPFYTSSGYYNFPRYTTSHKTEHGLFLSWTLVTSMISCLVAGVIGGRILYMKKKQKWIMESHTPKFMALYPNSNSEEGKELEVPPPLNLEAVDGGTQTLISTSRDKISSSLQAADSIKYNTTRSTGLTHIDGIPLARYLRYRSEFDELQALGAGGFGTVYKCLNKLDGRLYALKKVLIQSPLDQHGQLSPHFSKQFHRVLREVKFLALLDHPNIVRYYTAWLEIEDDDSANPSSLTIDDESTGYLPSGNTHSRLKSSGFSSDFLVGQAPHFPSSLSLNKTFQHQRYSSEEDLGFTWERSQGPQSSQSYPTMDDSNSINQKYDTYKHSAYRDDQSDSTGNEQYSQHTFITDSLNDMKSKQEVIKIQRHILYIQMQLSKKTLLDYFSARHSSYQQAPVDIIAVLHMFAHIARGVKHVHRQGLIHRDLKPSNCFMDDEDIVKIGDFGLSRESGVYADDEDVSVASQNKTTNSENTAGIGTSSYASPEQIIGSDYDSSTDVYSLGIIFFELCYPMMTGMERFKAFEGLRKSTPQFPTLWCNTVAKQFPIIHTLIQTMISHNPKDRPTADQVSTQIESLLSEHSVLLLDRNGAKCQEGSIFLRVEASESEGVLARTIQTIKISPDVTIVQYSLQGLDDRAIMEFALIHKNEPTHSYTGEMMEDVLAAIVKRLEASYEVKLVRQLNQTNL